MSDITAIIARARALLAEATTSPWEHRDGVIDEGAPVWEGVYDWNGHNVEDTPANCRFIAFARNNLGALLDEVEQLQTDARPWRVERRGYGEVFDANNRRVFGLELDLAAPIVRLVNAQPEIVAALEAALARLVIVWDEYGAVEDREAEALVRAALKKVRP